MVTKEVKKFLEDLFPKVAEAYGLEVIEQSVQSDHLHLYVSAPPRIAPAQIVDILKSISAREVFKKFPKVKQQLWGGELWSNGYFVRAVGDKITSFIIQRYIRYQRNEQNHKQRRLF